MTRLSRGQLADRLITGTVNKSYNPMVDVDWAAPLDPHKYFIPPTLISLYGTLMWLEMTEDQRIELSRQELGQTLSVGTWFENLLNQVLLRKVLHQDPTSHEAQYALMEVGDEIRHMVMFARTMERVGARPVWPKRWHRFILGLVPLAFGGSATWVVALIGEEIFHTMQRDMTADEDTQPLVRRVMKIHVDEEWRHIQFARDGLRRQVATMSRVERLLIANLHGFGAYMMFRIPFGVAAPYRRAGLDADRAIRAANESTHRRAVQVKGFAPLAGLLTELGLMGPLSRWMWRRAGFLPHGSG